MNYHRYYPLDVVNGPGVRCTLFVAGCEHRCKGCYNATTWPLDSGQPFTDEVVRQIIQDLNDPQVPRRGLSLSGGDPLHPANVEAVLALVDQVRCQCPGKDIWLWSGYRLEQLSPRQRALVARVDMLIDGKFEQDNASPGLPWRGSHNQRLIDVQTQLTVS